MSRLVSSVVLLMIGMLQSQVLVELVNGQDDGGPPCQKIRAEGSNVGIGDLHINTSLQLCLGFTCPKAALFYAGSQYVPAGSGMNCDHLNQIIVCDLK